MSSEERRLWARKSPEQLLADEFVKEFERLYARLEYLITAGDTSGDVRRVQEAVGLLVHHSMYDSLPFSLEADIPDSGYAESSYANRVTHEPDLRNFSADYVCDMYIDPSQERYDHAVVKVVYRQAASGLWITSWAGPPKITPVFPEVLETS